MGKHDATVEVSVLRQVPVRLAWLGGLIHTRRAHANSNANPLMLLACSVNTPIHAHRFHLLRVALRVLCGWVHSVHELCFIIRLIQNMCNRDCGSAFAGSWSPYGWVQLNPNTDKSESWLIWKSSGSHQLYLSCRNWTLNSKFAQIQGF